MRNPHQFGEDEYRIRMRSFQRIAKSECVSYYEEEGGDVYCHSSEDDDMEVGMNFMHRESYLRGDNDHHPPSKSKSSFGSLLPVHGSPSSSSGSLPPMPPTPPLGSGDEVQHHSRTACRDESNNLFSKRVKLDVPLIRVVDVDQSISYESWYDLGQMEESLEEDGLSHDTDSFGETNKENSFEDGCSECYQEPNTESSDFVLRPATFHFEIHSHFRAGFPMNNVLESDPDSRTCLACEDALADSEEEEEADLPGYELGGLGGNGPHGNSDSENHGLNSKKRFRCDSFLTVPTTLQRQVDGERSTKRRRVNSFQRPGSNLPCSLQQRLNELRSHQTRSRRWISPPWPYMQSYKHQSYYNSHQIYV